MIILEKNNIIYQTLTATRLEETIAFVAEHFVKYEYLTQASKLTCEEFTVFCKQYCEASLIHHLSIIALDKTTGELVGFAINEDLNSENTINTSQFYTVHDHYIPFIAMLHALSGAYLNLEKKNNHNFQLQLLGVKPTYQGKKIGQTLIEASEIIAKQHQFAYIVIEATSPITKSLCEKLQYINLGNYPYKDFVLDGKKPFEHILDYDGPYLFMRQLDVQA
jgi:ribosomal protein S18 acetylase RimI-like enzyme